MERVIEQLSAFDGRLEALETGLTDLRQGSGAAGLHGTDGQPSSTRGMAPGQAIKKLRGQTARSSRQIEELTEVIGWIERVLMHGTPTSISLRRAIYDIHDGVQGLARQMAIAPTDLPYPQRLSTQRFRISSQNQEDGLIWSIFKEIGTTTRRFVELGCGDNGGNSGFLASELGWSGLMVDASADMVASLSDRLEGRPVTILQDWIDRDKVDDLLRAHDLDGEIDLLSIDIDGNDYWVWEALSACSPRLVVVEYNSALGANRRVVVPHATDFARDPSLVSGLYYGASLGALAHLARRKGYRLVAGEAVNAFFLREDVAPQIPEANIGTVFKLYVRDAARRKAMGGDLFAALADHELPVIEVN